MDLTVDQPFQEISVYEVVQSEMLESTGIHVALLKQQEIWTWKLLSSQNKVKIFCRSEHTFLTSMDALMNCNQTIKQLTNHRYTILA